MTFLENSIPEGEASVVQCQNALVTRIALFLNYLSRKNFQKLLRDVRHQPISSEGELLKLMIAKRYIRPSDAPALKKTCLSFARAQEDTRFGSLCIEFEFLTQSNLNLALEEQERLAESGQTVFLGDLLVDAGMLSERQQKLVLQKQKMDIDFKDAAVGAAGKAREFKEKDITIHVPEDGLTAMVTKTERFNPNLSLTNLKEMIERNGIIYGMVDDNTLKTFLQSDASADNRFEVARGLAPVAGTDARIFYLFDRDYLSAGAVAEDGSIDYKNRGEIPFVSTDTVLAEKVPAKPGRDGVNVFGDVVEAEFPQDPDIICGNGVALSGDRLKAFAVTAGYPKLNQDGVLSVLDAHVIRGDVDFTTGHVKFTKNVFITGTIKNGFRVEAKDVVALAVDGGIIHAKGDVVVANGVTDASIKAGGKVSAGFIHRSTIACMGNMQVGKEVVESNLMLEGTFDMSRGKMYASSMSARGGARIYTIGSVKTVPSSIAVGMSSYIKNELNFLNRQIERCQNIFDKKTAEKSGFKERLTQIGTALIQLDKVDKKTGYPDYPSPEHYHAALAKLTSEKSIIERKITRTTKELQDLKQTIKHRVSEKIELKRQSHATPPKPILDISGRIFSGTQVRGIHSSTVMASDLARVRIIEMSCDSDRGAECRAWEMVTSRL
ncbi:MAG: FapA family protein [Desulfobacter sp.]